MLHKTQDVASFDPKIFNVDSSVRKMNKDNYITSTFGIKIQNLNQAKCGSYEIQ